MTVLMSQKVESNVVVVVTLNTSLRIKNSKTRNKSARQAVSVERSVALSVVEGDVEPTNLSKQDVLRGWGRGDKKGG